MDCLIFTGCLNQHGYGSVKVNGKSHLAHRVAYEKAFGPIPKGLVVMHSCDTPACIEPSHLSVGTQKQNVEDMIQKGRKACTKGTAHWKARLTEDQVKEIFLSDLSDSALAKQFAINRSVPWKIRRGQLWPLVTEGLAMRE
ncbi:hypothetical protein PF_00019 [Pseudomonas phage P413]|nr:hypothetical protein PF_00019 [Pseudomonas phage P413]